MKKIVLSEEAGRWFDADDAEIFDLSGLFGGGEPREMMYVTSSGSYILMSNSSYRLITKQEAAKWFSINGFKIDLPEELLESIGALKL
jgi:hypothetical protein